MKKNSNHNGASKTKAKNRSRGVANKKSQRFIAITTNTNEQGGSSENDQLEEIV